MRKIHAAGVAAALTFALTLMAGRARAQPVPPPTKKQQPLILQKQQLGTTGYALVARTRMRNGDCAGALEAFDAAITHSIDPTLQRDRGLCHEQLGHPYPAIDDYRAYLTAEPDAADAEGIRGRLARLEQSTTGRSSQGDDDDVPPAATGSASGGVAVSVGTAGASAGGDAQATTGSAGQTARDPMDYVEHDNDQMKSPLRRGKGFSIAPYFSEHKWFFPGSSFGESDTWAEAIGLQLRYSAGHVVTVFLEAAYQHFNANSGSTDTVEASISGLTSQLGLELRFPLDADYDNQLFVAPGIGFDHIVETVNLAGASSVSLGAIVPRARLGYRHLVAASAGIDLSLDAGMGKFATYSNPSDFPFNGPGSESALLALNVALVWGL